RAVLDFHRQENWRHRLRSSNLFVRRAVAASGTRTALSRRAGYRNPGGLRDQRWREAALDQVQSLGRNVDVACINAGVGVGGLFAETDLDAELNMVYLSCAGTVELAKYVVQHMLPRNERRILFTSSIAGEMVAPREAVYAATKAFGLSFADSLRYELRDTGVTVTALQPGPTDTDFFHRAGMDNTPVGGDGKLESSPQD